MPDILWGRQFMTALEDAGIIDEKVLRVVIDANWRDAVIIYMERTDSKRLLQVIPALTEARITYGPEVREPIQPKERFFIQDPKDLPGEGLHVGPE